jgi:NADH:ubiquinone oxidoreductase subunit 5 (subunit L)/multisubunit Na+/H+ antiporter MnhA subunit
MLVNRVGDLGLMLGISTAFLVFKSVDYAVIFALTPLVLTKTMSFFGMELSVVSITSFLIF